MNFDRVARVAQLFIGVLVVNRIAPFAAGLVRLAFGMRTFAAATAGATFAMRALLRTLIFPIAIVEGILIVARAFTNLREELRETGQSFGTLD